MRLHSLSLTAFGPFAGTEKVDFEDLNDAGLFLLTGPTGAGKSSLLDAVCFALYGTVPGARGVKALKSQHSPVETRPEVVLDFSVQGRRFVIRRTPEWSRPKKRGSGVIAEKASASITETTTGGEHLLSARAAEVGLLVGDLMGMNAAQFQQVALLPQGEFQTFLRATSQERHAVLQHLFRTDRFARIEEWVGDHSRRLREEAGAGESTVRRILDTVADRVAAATPEELTGDDLPSAAADGRAMAWVAEVLRDAEAEAAAAAARHEAARDAVEETRTRHRAAVLRVERRRRTAAARAALAQLEDTANEADQGATRLAAHQRVGRCRPVLELVSGAASARDLAAAARDRAVAALTAAEAPSLPGLAMAAPLSTHELSQLLDTARGHAVRLETLLPREQAAEDARRRLSEDQRRLEAEEQEQQEAAVRASEIPVEVERRTAALTAAGARAARLEDLTEALSAARERHTAAVLLPEVRRRLTATEERRRDARDRVQDAREALQDLVARRLAGMAAELAGALEDGAPCQVCGSLEHPRAATPAHDAVTDADHAAADDAQSDASRALEEVEHQLRELRARHDSLAGASGGLSCEEAADRIGELTAQAADAEAARAEVDALQTELRGLRQEQADLTLHQSVGATAVARLRESVHAQERTITAVSAEVSTALGDSSGVRSLRTTLQVLSAWCDLLVRTRDACRDLDEHEEQLAALTAQAVTAAAEEGFGTPDEVEAALLDEDVRGDLDRMLRTRVEEEARARAVLEDPDVAGDDHSDDSDDSDDSDAADRVAVLAAETAEAERTADQAGRTLGFHEDRVRSLRQQVDRLAVAMDAWAPVRDQSLRAEAIARLVRGTGHDNQLQMRLSAYVLATRLDQVVAAANERLGHMRDQRYLLQRTGRAERRGAQAGLGLEVLDQWTGDVRAPTTLSGGETFVVSLALALGLADVVTHEAGGTEVETLFVDEGFGTLDADTLDDVMDRLDGLRAGGRTVGVVSHVTEMRSRIPTQVNVAKGRSGSTVSVRTLVG